MSHNTTVRDIISSKDLSSSVITTSPGKPGKIITVNPLDVIIDYSYQRDLDVNHVIKIANNFNHRYVKTPTGFQDSSGKIYITDGQHTTVAAGLAGIREFHIYVTELPADSTPQQRIELQSQQFIHLNKSPKPVSRYHLYRNQLIQNNPDYLALRNMCAKVGVTPVDSNKKSNSAGFISHINILENAWFQISREHSEKALAFLRHHWPQDAICATAFYGLTRLMQKQAESAKRNKSPLINYEILANLLKAQCDDQKSIELLLKQQFKHLRAVSEGKSDILRAQALVVIYNQHLKDSGETNLVSDWNIR